VLICSINPRAFQTVSFQSIAPVSTCRQSHRAPEPKSAQVHLRRRALCIWLGALGCVIAPCKIHKLGSDPSASVGDWTPFGAGGHQTAAEAIYLGPAARRRPSTTVFHSACLLPVTPKSARTVLHHRAENGLWLLKDKPVAHMLLVVGNNKLAGLIYTFVDQLNSGFCQQGGKVFFPRMRLSDKAMVIGIWSYVSGFPV